MKEMSPVGVKSRALKRALTWPVQVIAKDHHPLQGMVHAPVGSVAPVRLPGRKQRLREWVSLSRGTEQVSRLGLGQGQIFSRGLKPFLPSRTRSGSPRAEKGLRGG